MSSTEISVKGLAELNTFLQQLPERLQKNVLRGALRVGANVIKAQAQANVPVSPPNSENARLYGDYEGALRDSIRLSVSAKGGKVIASVKAGGKKGKADVFYATWVEFGTAAHRIVAKGGKALGLSGHPVKVVMHPGAKPKPYMRPALESQAQAAVVAAAEYMKTRLATKEGLAAAADVEITPQ
jgi:HK97 gp10 family phage protein